MPDNFFLFKPNKLIITLYHGTTQKLSDKIKLNGFKSHTWFSTNKKRAKFFSQIKSDEKNDKPIILILKISKDELNLRSLIQQQTVNKNMKIIGYEYLLHSYKLKKLKPFKQYFNKELKK